MKYLGPSQSGSLADQTASRNTYGQYYRDRVMPDQTSTGARAAARTRWATAVSAWGSGSGANRLLWNAFSEQHPTRNSLGQSVVLSGVQMWIRFAVESAYFWSVSALLPPPADIEFVMQRPTLAQITVAGHTTGWTVTAVPAPAAHWLTIDSCGPLHSGVISLPGRSYWRRRSYVFAGSSTGSFAQATTPGDVWGIRVREWTGLASAPGDVGWLSTGWVFRDVAV